MNRIKDFQELETRIVTWIKDYVTKNKLNSLVVGVSGGIDSAVVSTLCARTGLPTYVLSMPLDSNSKNDDLSDHYTNYLEDNFENVTKIRVDLGKVYHTFMDSLDWRSAIGAISTPPSPYLV